MIIRKTTTTRDEWSAPGLGDHKPDIVIGGKAATNADFASNINMSWKLGSAKERHHINCNNRQRQSPQGHRPTFVENVLSSRIGDITEEYSASGDSLLWDEIYHVHPGVYSWELELGHSKGVSFHRQPDTEYHLFMGELCFIEPENRGAYWIRCDDIHHVKRAGGSTIYNGRGGALGIIKRVKFIDDNGATCWGEMTIDGPANPAPKTLTITVDPEWLNNAAFPVRRDPDIGYTTRPPLNGSIQNGILQWQGYYPSDDTTVQLESIHIACGDTPSTTVLAKVAIYTGKTEPIAGKYMPVDLVASSHIGQMPTNDGSFYAFIPTTPPTIEISATQNTVIVTPSAANLTSRYGTITPIADNYYGYLDRRPTNQYPLSWEDPLVYNPGNLSSGNNYAYGQYFTYSVVSGPPLLPRNRSGYSGLTRGRLGGF